MSGTDDRRAPGAGRTPFDGLVEVGGTLGPSFEAQGVNVSEEGMQLRTAYLPEFGQQVTCRFEAGAGHTVIASGDVVWSRGGDTGGEFGIRFTDVDPDSVEPLKRACGVAATGVPGQPGTKVRLYIDGLASPMRAKVRDSCPAAITVGSDLGFLQVGKRLELEDAQSGHKRPASIDRVDVAIDPGSHVPQLVVKLRYDDVTAEAAHDTLNRPASTAAPSAGEFDPSDDAAARMRSTLAHQAARVGPALRRFAQRTKVTAMLLMARGRAEEEPPRRTTAPAPGGGLHSLGRRVVRGEASSIASEDAEATPPRRAAMKRKAAVAAGVLTIAVVGALAFKRGHHDPASAISATGSTTGEAAPLPNSGAAPVTAPSSTAIVSVPVTTQAPASASVAAAQDSDESSHEPSHKKHLRPTPFGNGPVHHGNVLRLKMDGPIETIEGAQQPTGFSVKIPGHKSLEAAAPLAARDSRIAAIKVSNEPGGAELNVTFRDGVPNYQVSARGDSLVIDLAPPGALETTTAKRDDKGGKNPKHGTRERDTTPER